MLAGDLKLFPANIYPTVWQVAGFNFIPWAWISCKFVHKQFYPFLNIYKICTIAVILL